jgi:hypothetical protein
MIAVSSAVRPFWSTSIARALVDSFACGVAAIGCGCSSVRVIEGVHNARIEAMFWEPNRTPLLMEAEVFVLRHETLMTAGARIARYFRATYLAQPEVKPWP